MPKVMVYVISAGRAANVAAMTAHLEPLHATWLVPDTETHAYSQAGAYAVGMVGRLAEARNAALDRAFAQDAWCVQLDDDLRRIKILGRDGLPYGASVIDAIEYLTQALVAHRHARLAGAAPTDNAYFARGGPVRDWAFILGSLTVTAPTPLRYDTTLTLKEDWDYTCQHLWHYGAVARCDAVLPTFAHYTNKGGVQRYRDDHLEQDITDRLLLRWPGMLRPHGRRPHELALRKRALNLSSA